MTNNLECVVAVMAKKLHIGHVVNLRVIRYL
jgi:hypothetical protein